MDILQFFNNFFFFGVGFMCGMAAITKMIKGVAVLILGELISKVTKIERTVEKDK